MSLPKNHLELLSPARDVAIAREAILHGADAVYIGGPGFGARAAADNSVADIARLPLKLALTGELADVYQHGVAQISRGEVEPL